MDARILADRPPATADHVGRASPQRLSGPAARVDHCIRCQHAAFSALPSPLDDLGSPPRIDLLVVYRPHAMPPRGGRAAGAASAGTGSGNVRALYFN